MMFGYILINRKRCMCEEEARRMEPWNWKFTIKECSRLNFATNGKRLGAAPMEIIANLLMASMNFVLSFVTLATRLRSVEWSLLEILVLMVIAATFDMPSLMKRSLWFHSSSTNHIIVHSFHFYQTISCQI